MADTRPLHEQGDGEATFVPFDPEYEAIRLTRVRLKVRPAPHLACADPLERAHGLEDVWSPCKARWEIEKHVALGAFWLSIDFADGRVVESALIVPWTFD